MRKIVTISFVALNAPGGVPRWNRDIASMCEWNNWEHKHFCYNDVPEPRMVLNEWDCAKVLNHYLTASKKISSEDIILVDSFWGLGLEWHKRLCSVQHGNWSHTTLEDVQAGIPPEFPCHHAIQVEYRRKHLTAGGRMVAVSEFIRRECKRQWGFEMDVINNGIDTHQFKPAEHRLTRSRPLIIHFTTTTNKGLDHIDLLKREVDAQIMLLDEAYDEVGRPNGLTKYETLAQADLVVHPSAHEGNSYAILEALACCVPIVAYDVGYLWELKNGEQREENVGIIIDRKDRSPQTTLDGVRKALREYRPGDFRIYLGASRSNIEKFRAQWSEYLRPLHA